MMFSGILCNCILKTQRGGNSIPTLRRFPREAPLIKCSHGKKCLYIEIKPLLAQLVLSPCFLHVAPQR